MDGLCTSFYSLQPWLFLINGERDFFQSSPGFFYYWIRKDEGINFPSRLLGSLYALVVF